MRLAAVCTLVALLVAATLEVCEGHATLMYVGGSKTKFQYMVPSDMGNAPVKDLQAFELICRAKAIKTSGVDKLQVTAGESFNIQWQHINGSKSSPDWPVMSPSHSGPCIFYMSPLDRGGAGAVWFKTSEEGFDAAANKGRDGWCTNKAINNFGNYKVPVPKNIPSGDYLLRTEFIALHQAENVGGAQLYPNCIVVSVAGGTGTALPKLYDITKIYGPRDPGILFNRRDAGKKPYVVPGPPVMDGAGATTPSSGTTTSENKPPKPKAAENTAANPPAVNNNTTTTTTGPQTGNNQRPPRPGCRNKLRRRA
ncbi:hypothetical protein H4R18_000948 [Coemansia javaensis]|uniref:AA9 family lytic polysaccharide monooxygenase n=1 Tax=Coemansia javaensis TaxID=2761396 RepID=A0A9W8HEH4_9FUNG|nr:hypothetical protein H4R18_000948 [Coemansia javaensis]